MSVKAVLTKVHHEMCSERIGRRLVGGPIVQLVPEPLLGERIRVAVATHPPLVAEITAHALHDLNLHEGQRIYASFKATAARVYN